MTLDAIRNDIKQKAQAALQATANEVADVVHEKYLSFIDKFYASYSPVAYDRQEKAKSVGEKFNSVSATEMFAGVIVMGDAVSMYPSILKGRNANKYPVSGAWVFENVFVKGERHRPPGCSNVISPMGTPPMALMDEWFSQYAQTVPDIYFKHFKG